MLFKVKHLHGIKAGEISIAFRKWKKPTVTKGTLIKTAVGQIEILDISEINEVNISHIEAIGAGYKRLTDLTGALNSIREGNIYKIRVKYHSPDPRIQLRDQTELSEEEIDQIKLKLGKYDKYSKQGKWTMNILRAIRDNPKLRAQDLAAKTGKEKDWLKQNIRKLKNLGLTISHDSGYTISSRGRIFLDKMTNGYSINND